VSPRKAIISECTLQLAAPRRIRLPALKAACFHLAVRRRIAISSAWLPVLVWMLVIFTGSTNAGSVVNTSRFIAPVLKWLKPDISDTAVGTIILAIRKTAHVAEYAILAALLWRALRSHERGESRLWRWRQAGLALLLSVLYAASDEFHQSFVKSREASVRDVALDTAGASLGLLASGAFARWRGLW
jgi:VanZ family protein